MFLWNRNTSGSDGGLIIITVTPMMMTGFSRLRPAAAGLSMPGFSRLIRRRPSRRHLVTCVRSVNDTSWRREITSLFRRPLNPMRRVTLYCASSVSGRQMPRGNY